MYSNNTDLYAWPPPVARRVRLTATPHDKYRALQTRQQWEQKKSIPHDFIGELINASRKAIKAAIEAEDAETIQKVARDTAKAGVDDTDVNAGIFVGQEPFIPEVAG